MANICFLDAEFTDLLHPQLLSIGPVDLDGREHYVELDLACEGGQARVKAASDFVRWGGVLDLWGLVEGAKATPWEMGRRTGEWLLERAGARIEVCFDYWADYQLLEYAIRDAGLWDSVRLVLQPVNIDALTGTIEGEIAADECFLELASRGLKRHHALADALALRAAYLAAKGAALDLARRAGEPSGMPTDNEGGGAP